jgi:hypothetical protein
VMHWDAMLDDGAASCCSAGRFAGSVHLRRRVVPFTIARTPAAQTGRSRTCRPARSPTAPVPDDQRPRRPRDQGAIVRRVPRALLENFVILERSERHNKIARELDAKAQRLRGRVSGPCTTSRGCCSRCPIWSSNPSVIAGTIRAGVSRAHPTKS